MRKRRSHLLKLSSFEYFVLPFYIIRYTLTRYEDLIDDPLTSLRKIFLNLNLKFDKRYLNAFYSHTQTSEMADKDVEDFYFSVFRSKSFKHDHWKDEMNAEVINRISSLFLLFLFIAVIDQTILFFRFRI
jgi:hypothetical protein